MSVKEGLCPNCGERLIFRPISTLFDIEGKRFGFRLACSNCDWSFSDKDYSFEEVEAINK